MIGSHRPDFQERHTDAGLDAAGDRLVHVDALAEALLRGEVAVVDAAWQIRGTFERAVGDRGAGRDFVVELVVEEGHAGAQASLRRVVGADFGARARFGPQARASDGGNPALSGEADDAVDELFDAWRLVSPADAAFQG